MYVGMSMYICVYVCIEMGCLGRGKASGCGLVMSFIGHFIHHWYPPDTKLPPMAPWSSLHVTVAIHWETVLTVRVTARYKILSELGACLCQHVDFPSGMSGRDHLDPMANKTAKQCTVGCSELGKAPKMPKHPLHPDLSPAVLILSCYWIQAGLGERVKLMKCNSPLLYSRFHASHNLNSHPFPSDGWVAKWQVWTEWQL